MKKGISCIIFDIGGVLITERIDPVYDKLNRHIGKKVFDRTGNLEKKRVSGIISEREFFVKLSQKCGVKPDILKNMEKKEYTEMIKDNQQMIDLSKKLKRNGYNIGILSNISPLHKSIRKHIF